MRTNVNSRLAGALAVSTGERGRVERFVHDPPDGGGASSALRAAAEATVDLTGRTRTRFRRYRGADIVVGQNVARADDHVRQYSWSNSSILELAKRRKEKSPYFIVRLILPALRWINSRINRVFRGVRTGPQITRPRRLTRRRCRPPPPRPASCRRLRPSPGSPAPCRKSVSAGGAYHQAAITTEVAMHPKADSLCSF